MRSHIQTSLDENFIANLDWKIVTLRENIRYNISIVSLVIRARERERERVELGIKIRL